MSYDAKLQLTPSTVINPTGITGELAEPAQETPGFIGQAREAFGHIVDAALDALPAPPRKLTAGIAAGALAMGLTPAVAGANIVVGKSVGGVRLGQTKAQVKKEVGPPYNDLPDPQSHRETWLYAAIKGKKIPPVTGVFFTHGKVSEVVTENPAEKTSQGIGSGATEGDVKKAYPDAKCQAIGLKSLHAVTCYLEQTEGKQTVMTLFALQKGKVQQVELSLPENVDLG